MAISNIFGKNHILTVLDPKAILFIVMGDIPSHIDMMR